MTGLKIRTITGVEFEVHGAVDCTNIPDIGMVYYCAGQSWPASIVVEVITSTDIISA